MKKISLSIQEPCHESWDAMTQQEKGKFCVACQKTVIDFSNMSDRQLADFFKKPKEGVCGRFHQDQLGRGIAIPKKTIPWVKYFFHVTWPAFVLFLKGCGPRGDGECAIKATTETKVSIPKPTVTMGVVMEEITPVDTTIEQRKKPFSNTTENLVGDVEVITNAEQKTKHSINDNIESDTLIECTKEAMPMDTVVVTSYANIRKTGMVMGGVTSVKVEIMHEEESKRNLLEEKIQIVAFPNPIKAGQELKIKPSSNVDSKQWQLYSSSGALIAVLQTQSYNSNNIKLMLPSHLAPGIYFLHLANKSQSETVKIIVTN